MIRKLLFIALSAFLLAGSAMATDHNVVLSADGTLYRAEAVDNSKRQIDSSSKRVIRLDVVTGGESTSLYVPATLEGNAVHSNPSLAYHEDSATLFVFWQKAPNPMSSELLFCSYSNGVWSAPTSFSKAAYNYRTALKIALTSYYLQYNGVTKPATLEKGLSIHAIWWEITGYGEEAHYALLTLENGGVTGIETHRLLDLTAGKGDPTPFPLPADYDRSLFREPAMFTSPSHDAVDVFFANWETNRFNKVTIRPIKSEGVIRIPGGVWGGELRPPVQPVHPEDGAKIAVSGGTTTGNVAIYTVGAEKLEFVLYKNGEWTDVKSIGGDAATLDAAAEALDRLVNSD